jgi:hypothetical protein
MQEFREEIVFMLFFQQSPIEVEKEIKKAYERQSFDRSGYENVVNAFKVQVFIDLKINKTVFYKAKISDITTPEKAVLLLDSIPDNLLQNLHEKLIALEIPKETMYSELERLYKKDSAEYSEIKNKINIIYNQIIDV